MKVVNHVRKIEGSRFKAELIMDSLVDENKIQDWNLQFEIPVEDSEVFIFNVLSK